MKMIIYFCPLWFLVYIKMTRTREASDFLTNNENKNFIKWIQQQTEKVEAKPASEQEDRPSAYKSKDIISDITNLSVRHTSPLALKSTSMLRNVEADKRRKKVPSVLKKKSTVPDTNKIRHNKWNIAESNSSSFSPDEVYRHQSIINAKETGNSSVSSTSMSSGRKSAERAMDLYNDWDA